MYACSFLCGSVGSLCTLVGNQMQANVQGGFKRKDYFIDGCHSLTGGGFDPAPCTARVPLQHQWVRFGARPSLSVFPLECKEGWSLGTRSGGRVFGPRMFVVL